MNKRQWKKYSKYSKDPMIKLESNKMVFKELFEYLMKNRKIKSKPRFRKLK